MTSYYTKRTCHRKRLWGHNILHTICCECCILEFCPHIQLHQIGGHISLVLLVADTVTRSLYNYYFLHCTWASWVQDCSQLKFIWPDVALCSWLFTYMKSQVAILLRFTHLPVILTNILRQIHAPLLRWWDWIVQTEADCYRSIQGSKWPESRSLNFHMI